MGAFLWALLCPIESSLFYSQEVSAQWRLAAGKPALLAQKVVSKAMTNSSSMAHGKASTPSFYAAFGSKATLFNEEVECYLTTHAQVTAPLWDDSLAPRLALETTFRQSATMQYETGHPRGCMVALSAMSCSTEESRGLLKPLALSRARTRDGIKQCIQRGIDSGELKSSDQTRALAVTFDSFLLGISTLARDAVPLDDTLQGITQVLKLWDIARR